ncbi:MAG: protein jag [Lachnospiraceae bacterium]|nr:protein jag [Lachnospiraceae bacterium]
MSEWMEFTGKTVDEALTNALINFSTTSDKVDYEVIEKESNGILGLFAKKDAVIRVKLKDDIKDNAINFLNKVFAAMNIVAEVVVDFDETEMLMNIDLKGDDMGILIGKRGQTLDSLQYLTSLVVNKNSKSYVKVKLDTENYRHRRKETLENLAKNIAHKVKKTRRSVVLEPMNPYERRIIHSSLQGDKYVDTHSEGDEPYRKVVVTLKKGLEDSYPGGYHRRSNYRNGKGNGRYNGRRNSYRGPKEEVNSDITTDIEE